MVIVTGGGELIGSALLCALNARGTEDVAADTERMPRGLYNIWSGVAHMWLDLVRPIFRAMDLPERIEFIDMPAVLRGKTNTIRLRLWINSPQQVTQSR